MSEHLGDGPGPFAPPGGPRPAGPAPTSDAPQPSSAPSPPYSPYAAPVPNRPPAPYAGPAQPAPPSPYAAPAQPAPPSPYAAPTPPYAAPTSPYAAPTSPYAAPTSPYAAPTSPYAAPGGYAAPVSYAAPPSYPAAYPTSASVPYAAPSPYGQPVAYGAPVPYYGEPPNEGMAVAALVTSLAGLVVLGGLPGLIGVGLGIGALRRIRRHGTRGRGQAIAGIVVGAVSTVVFVGWVSLAVWAAQNEDATGGTTAGSQPPAASETVPDYTLRTDLTVGDCLRDYPDAWDLGSATPVDCATPHALEIVSTVPMVSPVDWYAPDDEYTRVFSTCAATIEGLAPGLVDEDTTWTDVSFPHPDDWPTANVAYCAVARYEPVLVGSVRDGTVTVQGSATTT